jgi:hypothetical protein
MALLMKLQNQFAKNGINDKGISTQREVALMK